jgi:uncharacterized protein (AIM24 family)
MHDQICGEAVPVLEIGLDPGESVCAAGEFAWMAPSIALTASDCGEARGSWVTEGLAAASSIKAVGVTTYTAVDVPGSIAFGAKLPGQILSIDVDAGSGTSFLAHPGTYLCSEPGVTVEVGLAHTLDIGVPEMQRLTAHKIGGSGRAGVGLVGGVVSYDLPAGYALTARPGHMGVVDSSVECEVTTLTCVGRDDVLVVKLAGPGRVWFQSAPTDRVGPALVADISHSAGVEYFRSEVAVDARPRVTLGLGRTGQ